MSDDIFIKQCDCPEIQEEWEPKMGDWCTMVHGLSISGNRRYNEPELFDSRKKVYQYVWLPSETDLWDMVWPSDTDTWAVKMDGFRKWFVETNHSFHGERRKFLLAWVVWENHSKKWDGEGWSR